MPSPAAVVLDVGFTSEASAPASGDGSVVPVSLETTPFFSA